jgi:hypothetical protein
MRRKLVLIVVFLGLLWSLLALGAYTLIDGAGGMLAELVGAAGLPGEVLGLVLVLIKGLALGIVLVVWLVGTLILVTLGRGAMGAGLTVTTFGRARRTNTASTARESPPFGRQPPDLPADPDQALTLEQRPDGSWGPPPAPGNRARDD